MRTLWTLAAKDLRRRMRAPLAAALVLAFPLIFSGLLALAFGSDGAAGLPRARVEAVDRDGTFVSGLFVSALSQGPLAGLLQVEPAGPDAAADPVATFADGEASAVLVVPEGFAADLLAGRPVRLELIRNPAQGILPEIAEQALRVVVDGLDGATFLLAEPLSQLGAIGVGGDGGGQGGTVAPTSEQVAAASVLVHGAVRRAAPLLLPPTIGVAVERPADDAPSDAPGFGGNGSIFLLILPGVSVWALFLIGDVAMRDLLVEQRLGTLRRQLAAPAGARMLVLGKALYAVLLSGIGLLVLGAIGAATLDRGVSIPGFLLVAGATLLTVAGFGAAVYGLAPTERAGATFSSVVLLVFAFLGGAFLPVDSMPAAVRGLAPISPFYWATQGFVKLIRDGGGAVDVLPNAGVLAAIGALLLPIGALLMERRLRRGGAA